MKLSTMMIVGVWAVAAHAYVQPAWGEEPAAAEAAPAPVAESVAAALKELPSFNGAPSATAEYYIYLQSASWCGPCVKEMPEIARAYEEMKGENVELILIGCDDTPAAALKFLERFQATFPGIHYKEEGLKSLPGYKPAYGVPDATFVDRQGRVIFRGHGAYVKRWRQVLNKQQAAPQN